MMAKNSAISSTSSNSSRISSSNLRSLMNRLLLKQNHDSTNKMYMEVWRQFNAFLISLDTMPVSWEDRTMLFITNLVGKGFQSSSIKSYVSAVKRILINDRYQWDNTKILILSLTRACRLINDQVRTRLGISKGLLELVLFENEKIFRKKEPTIFGGYV